MVEKQNKSNKSKNASKSGMGNKAGGSKSTASLASGNTTGKVSNRSKSDFHLIDPNKLDLSGRATGREKSEFHLIDPEKLDLGARATGREKSNFHLVDPEKLDLSRHLTIGKSNVGTQRLSGSPGSSLKCGGPGYAKGAIAFTFGGSVAVHGLAAAGFELNMSISEHNVGLNLSVTTGFGEEVQGVFLSTPSFGLSWTNAPSGPGTDVILTEQTTYKGGVSLGISRTSDAQGNVTWGGSYPGAFGFARVKEKGFTAYHITPGMQDACFSSLSRYHK